MKRLGKILAAAVFAAAGLFVSHSLKAQDPPPPGGFKNAYLTVNKSGKVALTYTLWKNLVGKGKYTLAFFWGSYSEECREEVPFIKAIHQKYGGKIDVIGVTYFDEITDSMEAMTELGIRFPQIVDVDEDIAGPFEIASVPFTVLLGPEGKVVASGMRGVEIERAVAEAVAAAEAKKGRVL